MFQDGTDPYKNLPLLFGSMIEVSSSRMIMAKHQAALIWARQECLKKASVEARDRILRKYLKGIQQLMKNDKRKVQEEDLLEFNSFMVGWRDFLPQPSDDSVINYPQFDVSKPEEDDIFMYQGYMKPGVHNLIIYDPSSRKFFKMSNIVVFPRTEDIKIIKQVLDPKQVEDREEKREAMEYHGTNYTFIK